MLLKSSVKKKTSGAWTPWRFFLTPPSGTDLNTFDMTDMSPGIYILKGGDQSLVLAL
jgi:hypothetical protein